MHILHLLLPIFLLQLNVIASNTTYTIPTTFDHQSSSTSPTSPASHLLNITTFTCHDITHQLPTDQCQFALDYCSDYKIGFINYVNFYYCHNERLITLFTYSLVLIVLFTTLGLTASDFLCPNLDTISKFFKMSESLSGVTLLALGNGSPDLFSTLEAMKIDSASLAIGELIGAALFITCVVVGSMAIVRPFKVAKRPFVRDIIFLLISLSLTVFFLSDGTLSQWECMIMILLYLVYVVFVVCWDWISTKRRKDELINRKIRNRFIDENSRSSDLRAFEIQENNELNDDDIVESLNLATEGIEVLDTQLDLESNDKFNQWTKSSTFNTIRPSILGAIDFNTKMNDIRSSSNGYSTAGQISLRTLPPSAPISTATTIRMSSAPVYRDEVEDQDDLLTPGEYEERVTQSSPADFNDYGMSRDESDYNLYDRPDYSDIHDIVKTQVKSFLERNGSIKTATTLYYTIFPTLKDFNQKPILDKLVGIICLPLITILRLTIPVIETENKQIILETTWKRGFILLILQCLISPFVTYILISYDDKFTADFIIIPLIITIFTILSSYLIKSTYNKQNKSLPQITSLVLSALGFLISICWISTIATELISIIKFFALIFGLSDAILGVTVFAIGNSLGDFISNFTIAKMGFPMMALSACFGGPLLNILLGIGGSGLYVIPMTGADIELHVSKTLIVSFVTVLANLVLLLVVVPVNGWEMNKQIGWSMIGLWSVATSICVIFEVIG